MEPRARRAIAVAGRAGRVAPRARRATSFGSVSRWARRRAPASPGASFVAPRVLGRGRGRSARAGTRLRRRRRARRRRCGEALAGANVRPRDPRRGPGAPSSAPTATPRPTTPEIDRIAAEGVVFERAYTPAVYTLGAMSSVWTSQYPDRHHSEVSFSARLPEGPAHAGRAALRARASTPPASWRTRWPGCGFGFDRGFDEFHELFRTLGSRGDVFREALPPWLAREPRSALLRLPPLPRASLPVRPRRRPSTRCSDRTGRSRRPPGATREFFKDVNQGRRPFSEAEREHLVRLYDGNLAFADQEVGALRRALEDEGLWERTVVIVAADHGEELYERGWIGHNVHVFEPSVRVPLVVRFPKGVGPAGARIEALTDLLDLAPDHRRRLRRSRHGRAPTARSRAGACCRCIARGAGQARGAVAHRLGPSALRACATSASSSSTTAAPARRGSTTSRPTPARAATSRRRSPSAPPTIARRSTAGRCGSGGGARPGARPPALSAEQCENLRALGYLEASARERARRARRLRSERGRRTVRQSEAAEMRNATDRRAVVRGCSSPSRRARFRRTPRRRWRSQDDDGAGRDEEPDLRVRRRRSSTTRRTFVWARPTLEAILDALRALERDP